MRARRVYRILPSQWDELSDTDKDYLLAEQIHLENTLDQFKESGKSKEPDEKTGKYNYDPTILAAWFINRFA